MILRNLLRRKTRTLLTLIGISIGVAAVVALGAMSEGMINAYDSVFTGSGADLILTQKDATDILFSAVDEAVGLQVATMSGVKQVAGTLFGIVTTPEMPFFLVFGLEPNEFPIKHYKVSEGQTLSGTRQILLGKGAAKHANKKVGEYFKVLDVSFRVVGIYETGTSIEESGAVIALRDAQDAFKKPKQVSYYQIKTLKPEQIDPLTKELERRYSKLTASRSANYMEQQQEAAAIRGFGMFIGAIAIFAGGLGMMNTMLMSVYERTREIGVLRAVGWKRGRVLQLILGETLALCLLGGISGSILGALILQGLAQIPVVASFVESIVTPGIFVQGVVVAVLLGAAGGAYPAWRASRLQPAEALRYDGGSGKAKAKSAKPPVTSRHLQFLISNLFGMAFRNLFRQRTRTILTMLAIGVGVGLVVAMGGLADGFVQQLAGMGNKNGELTVTEAKAAAMTVAAVDEQVGRWVATLSNIEQVSGVLLGIATVPGTPYFLAFGVEPNSFAMKHYTLSDGARLRSPREVILGKVAAKNLKKKVGNTILISGSSYRVVGIYETGVGYEDAGGVIALKEAQTLLKKPNQVSLYYLKLKNPNRLDETRQQIEARWSQVSASRTSEYAEKNNQVTAFRAEASALSFISILIGGVGIMNAMLMSVSERTREIGTLRALGWRRRRIVAMILRESALLSIFSGGAGIGVGFFIGWLISLDPYTGGLLQSHYSPALLLSAMLLALGLGAVGGAYPALRASNLSPVEALRYE